LVGHVARMGEMREANNILAGKPERKRHGCTWDDNIMNLREMGWKSVYWMHLAQDRDQRRAFMNAVMNFRFR